MHLFLDGLLYFTAFGTTFALFASVVAVIVWLVKACVRWVITEPEPKASKELLRQNLNHLKRAGQ
jgi:hypothetical protein